MNLGGALMDKSTQLIFKYITKIEKERNINTVLLDLSDMARELIDADRCTLWLYDEEKHKFWTKIAHGIKDKLEMSADKGIIGLALKEKKAFIVDNPYSHPHFSQEVDEKTGYKTENIMVVPIKNMQRDVIGVYQTINKKDGSFTDYDINYLKLVATYSAEIIETAYLYKEIEETQKEIVFRMGDIAEAKSRETGNHIKRVAEYTRVLATGYGMSPLEVNLIVLASPMHDIGKIAIPDEILHKPGKLTPEEFEVIKTHSAVGGDLLKFSKRKLLKAASIIAYEHHEKWNGKGYPKGLAGEEIHIYGRILALADVFDALISDRCYKKAWPLDKVVNLFKEERGEHFDPKLVDIFLDKVSEFIAIKDKYLDQFTYEDTLVSKS